MVLKPYFADMHIHIGRDDQGNPVKITGAKNLTLTNVLIEASQNKGLDMIGVIDCHVPAVQREIKGVIDSNQAEELKDGGIRFERVTLIMGSEIEIYDENSKGPIHVLVFFPYLSTITAFTKWLTGRMTNIHLSSQRYYGSARELQNKVKELSGLFIPAHIFTPFKSLYGKGVKQSLTEVLDASLIDAVELGLSSDTNMVNGIEEINSYSFLSNSDAHSLGKIGREYQQIYMESPTFKEFSMVLHCKENRKVLRNFGMNPLLGKYYFTVCKNCLHPVPTEPICPNCGSSKKINGVKERIEELTTSDDGPNRPPYIYQVPLDFIPKLGPKTLQKLLDAFQTEMNIIHHADLEELKEVVSSNLAEAIIANRNGKLEITAGGGGKYGKVITKDKEF